MSWLDGLRERVINLFVARDHELTEEINYHIELETRRHIDAGVDPRVARARALARFGDRRQITDATRAARGDRLMEGGMQDLKWALRSLRKSPGFTLLALFTLTLGIGATTAAFTVLNTVLLSPMPYPESDRIVVVEELDHNRATKYPSYPNFDDWRTQTRSFERVTAVQNGVLRITPPSGDAVRAPALGVSRGFFEMLRVHPIIGRSFTSDENRLGGPKVLMVSYEFWRDHLDSNPILGTVRMGTTIYQIVGVMPSGFQFMAKYDAFFPNEQGPGTVRSAHYLTVVARLAKDASLTEARTEMTALSRRLFLSYGNETQAEDARVTPLRDFYVGAYDKVLMLVFGAAALVLLVACTNMVSAQLARGLVREREIAVRAALGASRRRLIRQLLAESLMLALAGTVMGTALGAAIIAVVRSMGQGLLPRLSELAMRGSVLGFVAGTAALVTLIIGIYPAMRVVRRDAAETLRGGSRTGATTVRGSVWHVLIGVEVAMAVVLVCGSALLVKTLHNILTTNVGFEIHGLLTASLSSGDATGLRLDALRSDLAALPGVKAVAYSNQMPLSWGTWAAPVLRPTDPVDHDWPAFAGFRIVTPNYFDVLRQPIVRGRPLTDDDRADSPAVAVITPGIAERLWPGEDPIGKIMRSNMDTTWLTVVGVVTEARNWTMQPGSQNEIYVPRAQHPTWNSDPVAFIRASGNANALMGDVTKFLRAEASEIPARVGLLEDRVATTAASRRFAMFALVTFGCIALVLAAVGIYGVLAYSVASRRFEIGVRMALGATSGSILRGTLASAATMTMSGVVVGGCAATIVLQFLKSLLYEVTPFEPTAYAAACFALFAVALLGAFAPARRASRTDPMLAIRGEQ
ncbi:MAG TPA: ABC transporter permease [Gemmatimonadaceae bacterium]